MRVRHALGLLALIAAAASAVAPTAALATTTVAPSALDFGSVPVGTTSASHPVDINVVCSAPVAGLCPSWPADDYFVNVHATGDFTSTDNCGNPLGLGLNVLTNSCTINVTFTPTGSGLRSGTLNTGTTDVTGLIPGPAVALTGIGTTSAGDSAGASARPSSTVRLRKKCKRHRHQRALSAKRKCRRHHLLAS